MESKFLIITIGVIVMAGAAIIILISRDRSQHIKVSSKDKKPYKPEARRQVKDGRIIYDKYNMCLRDKIIYGLAASAVIAVGGYVFYRSIIVSILLMPLGFLYPGQKTVEIIRKRKAELNMQFKDMLSSVASSLMAGKSVEGSFKDALADLKIQYSDPDCCIIRELENISLRLEMNDTIEAALEDLANRSQLEDIKSFVNVFQACKRTGGDLVQVIKSSTDIINDKIYLKQEIDSLIIQRRFEQKVLSILPFALVALITSSSSDFISPVYTTLQGRLSMTIAILLFLAAHFISGKIMNIEV
ncbi:MAG: type II secretion system F family protein [Bacillota bacterium]